MKYLVLLLLIIIQIDWASGQTGEVPDLNTIALQNYFKFLYIKDGNYLSGGSNELDPNWFKTSPRGLPNSGMLFGDHLGRIWETSNWNSFLPFIPGFNDGDYVTAVDWPIRRNKSGEVYPPLVTATFAQPSPVVDAPTFFIVGYRQGGALRLHKKVTTPTTTTITWNDEGSLLNAGNQSALLSFLQISSSTSYYLTPSDFIDLDTDGFSDQVLVGGANGKIALLNVQVTSLVAAAYTVNAYMVPNAFPNWNANIRVGKTRSSPTIARDPSQRFLVGLGFEDNSVEIYQLKCTTYAPRCAGDTWIKLRNVLLSANRFNPPSGSLNPSPGFLDLDLDSYPDALIIGTDDNRGGFAFMFFGKSSSQPCQLSCLSGRMQMGCQCVACPRGTYRSSTSSFTWCLVAGSPDYYAPSPNGIFTFAGMGSTNRVARTVGKCTYNAAVEASEYALYASQIVVASPSAPSTSYGLSTMAGSTILATELYGGMSTMRDAEGECGLIKVYSENQNATMAALTASINVTVVLPGSARVRVYFYNSGELSANATVSAPSFASLIDVSTGIIYESGAVVVIPPGSRVYDIRLASALINPALLAGSNSLISQISLINVKQYWSQGALFAQTFPNVFVNFRLTVTRGALTVLPTDVSYSVRVDSTLQAAIELINVEASTQTWDASHFQVTDVSGKYGWFYVSPGTHSNGSLLAGCSCRLDINATCDALVPQNSSDYSDSVFVTVDATGDLPSGSYEGKLIITTRSAPIDVNVKLQVLPGPFRIASSPVFWESSVNTNDMMVSQPIHLIVVPNDRHGSPTDELGYPLDGNATLLNDAFRLSYGLETSAGIGGGSNSASCPVDVKCNGTVSFTWFPGVKQWEAVVQIPATGTYSLKIFRRVGNTVVFIVNDVPGTPLNSVSFKSLKCPAVDANSVADILGTKCECIAGYGKTSEEGGGYVRCAKCAPGLYSATIGSTCSACPAGTVQGSAGQTSCMQCKRVEESNPERTACSPCPYNALVPIDSLNATWSCRTCEFNKIVARNDDGRGTVYVNTTSEPAFGYRCACRPDYFSSGTSVLNQTCAKCPTGGYCAFRDASTLLPRPGYWKTTWGTPPEFIKCRFSDACPGVNIADADFYDASKRALAEAQYALQVMQGNILPSTCSACSPSYSGAGCQKCSVGHSRSGRSECVGCLPKEVLVLFIVLGIIFVSAIIVYFIRRTIVIADRDSDELVVLRIITSHLQVIAMLQGFDLKYPLWLLKVYEIFDLISSAGASLFSVDCIVDIAATRKLYETVARTNCGSPSADDGMFTNISIHLSIDSAFDPLRVRTFFIQALFLGLLPLITVFISGAFWIGRFTYVKWYHPDKKSHGRKYFNFAIISVIICLFLLQPTLCRIAFAFFACTRESINGVHFLESDSNIQCFGIEHLAWSLSLGVLMLLFYVFGVPIAAYYLLRKHVHENSKSKYRNVYSFLYSGYKEQFYYWEVCVVMPRKILFAAISVLLNPFGSDEQAFAGLLVIFTSLLLQVHFVPYVRVNLNRVEFLSLLVCFCTLFFGLVVQSSNTGPFFAIFLAWLILTMNIAFLVYAFRVLYHATSKYFTPPREAARIASKRFIALKDSVGSFRNSFRREDSSSANELAVSIRTSQSGNLNGFTEGSILPVDDREESKASNRSSPNGSPNAGIFEIKHVATRSTEYPAEKETSSTQLRTGFG